mgnify:CR=1 FL=1
MSRWFRFYDEVLDDPKVQRLSDALYRRWTDLLCIASRNEGRIPGDFDALAFVIRQPVAKVRAAIDALVSAGLLDKLGDDYTPHGWASRQYASDSSAERMRRHRQKKRDGDSDGTSDADVTSHPTSQPVTVTAPLCTSDGAEQNRAEQSRYSVSKDTGGEPPNGTADPVKALFDFGISVLTDAKVPERQARAEIGKWRKALRDDGRLMGLLVSARQNHAVEPVAYLERAVSTAAAKAKYGGGYVPPGVGG